MLMSDSDTRTYRTAAFARLAGVTPRALHHYDRLGLLKPKRSAAGYRTYTARDMERLEQIIALKFIGLPLRKIRAFTARTTEGLAQALRAQRQVLEQKRQLLDQAIAAIGEAERAIAGGQPADPTVYRRIIEVIEMQNNSEEWNRKYEALLQAKMARLKALTPEEMTDLRGRWDALVTDIRGSLDADPAGAHAQGLATRWIQLLERLMGGPVDESMLGHAGAARASGDRPAGAPPFVEPAVWDFMRRALAFRQRSAR
jgi:MerR family transcriptional regulator, thiopeptide resistance regulator